ncbi:MULTISPECIES: hypothetical protein [Bacillus amyloliquefaciens group]|nr:MULTISPECIES: hypothetical protein [Bacillus amyloliquefaciens group]AMQ71558.1 hypothetical protein BAMY6639_12570 [Bacillus amyloliquefaciens UMAF6639]MDH3100678.1 hypothetical protein [Bacillus velezensis]
MTACHGFMSLFKQGQPHHTAAAQTLKEVLIGKDLAMTIDTKTTK